MDAFDWGIDIEGKFKRVDRTYNKKNGVAFQSEKSKTSHLCWNMVVHLVCALDSMYESTKGLLGLVNRCKTVC